MGAVDHGPFGGLGLTRHLAMFAVVWSVASVASGPT